MYGAENLVYQIPQEWQKHPDEIFIYTLAKPLSIYTPLLSLHSSLAGGARDSPVPPRNRHPR